MSISLKKFNGERYLINLALLFAKKVLCLIQHHMLLVYQSLHKIVAQPCVQASSMLCITQEAGKVADLLINHQQAVTIFLLEFPDCRLLCGAVHHSYLDVHDGPRKNSSMCNRPRWFLIKKYNKF